jgi:hypothetical protein
MGLIGNLVEDLSMITKPFYSEKNNSSLKQVLQGSEITVKRLHNRPDYLNVHYNPRTKILFRKTTLPKNQIEKKETIQFDARKSLKNKKLKGN